MTTNDELEQLAARLEAALREAVEAAAHDVVVAVDAVADRVEHALERLRESVERLDRGVTGL